MSSFHRKQNIGKLKEEQFDCLVIGGGITGAGIALDAASRGLKVALIEKSDFASGTSSKSTKLIHGGLRYLKQFEVALVREVGQERATVHRLAPHLVIPEKMLLPFTDGGTFGYWSTSLALKVYDLLAGVGGKDKRIMLSKQETLKEEPLLRQDILKGAGLYAEYRTDDARLTIEVLKTSCKYDALPVNYVEALAIKYDEDGKNCGAKCKDQLTNEVLEINATQVINAAGPWVDELRKKDNSLNEKHLFLSKGVHVVVPHHKLPLKHSVYIDAPDGRMIFLIPRLEVTYIGTTDTAYTKDKDNIGITKADVEYLIASTNVMFPSATLKFSDVVSSWAGLRPLIHEEGKSPSEISRKDEIFESASGLLSIAGGKLTGYRVMARKIVDRVIEKEVFKDLALKKCMTDKIPFTGGEFKNSEEVQAYLGQIEKKISVLGLAKHYAAYLVYNYGRQTDDILDQMKRGSDAEIELVKSEVEFCIQHEQVHCAEDFFNRRSGRLYFKPGTIEKCKSSVVDVLATTLKWSDQRIAEERRAVDLMLKQVTSFESS